MEESSDAHMDTDVSSTTEDILEIQEVTGSHRNVETVIVVEKIKEEDLSPNKDKKNDNTAQPQATTSEKHDPVINIEKTAPKFVQFKKIIIKSPNKDSQVQKPLQKSPSKPEAPLTNVEKSTPPIKPVNTLPIGSLQSEDVVDSSSKADTSKLSEKEVKKGPVKAPVVQIAVEISPKKDLQMQEPRKEQSKATVSTPLKEQPAKPSVAKMQTIKIIPFKEQPIKVFPVKEQQSKVSPVKEQLIKVSQIKEQSKKATAAKESPPKDGPAKDPQAKSVLAKEQPEKQTPNKDKSAKSAQAKQQPKTPAKELAVEKSNAESKDESLSKSTMPLDDVEASNDSQTNSDISEKDHNKSISRELKSLINSAKESKIISECTQLTGKTRKSRTALDTSNTSLNTSVEADKIQGMRRGSDNSQKSNCSEKSEKSALKRSMRSQNPEFVSKVKQFLNSVTGKIQKDEGDASDEETRETKTNEHENDTAPSVSKKKKQAEEEHPVPEKTGKLRTDPYCWRCHWAVEPAPNDKTHHPMQCTVCPRSFHYKCLTGPERNKINMDKNWVCPECLLVLHAESSETRSLAMKKISLGMLCDLLKHALERMMDLNGVEPFMHPVDRGAFPDYDKYVVHPMDLSQMKKHIADGLYGSTEAFLADAQWILHNSIIFNTLQSKLTGGARALVRSCRAEMGEIEACPECYAAAHARRPTWFTDVCSTPHVLLWAKLKGFPYWPAKGMSVSNAGMVDVRFFGAHDRAWVPARDCFLFSEKDPNNFRTKRQDILDSMQEAEQHIRNISRKYGVFVYPPFKTQFDPTKLNEQLKMMIPSFEGEVRSPVKDKAANSSPGMVKEKSRSNSKSSKCSLNDGDTSEGEDTSTVPARKMADGAEIAREEDFCVEKDKDKSMEVDVPSVKDSEASRKRRRSELEEAVITVLDSSTSEKRKRLDNDVEEVKTTEASTSKEAPQKAKEDKAKDNNPEKSNGTTQKTSGEPSSEKKAMPTPKVAPIRVISIDKVMRNIKANSSPKSASRDEKSQEKRYKVDKTSSTEIKASPHEDKTKSQKRRTSRNKSLNNSNAGNKSTEKKNENSNKDQSKDNSKSNEASKSTDNSTTEKSTPTTSNTASPQSMKERLQFDDDTSLAVIARENKSNNGLPTITSVRSLSTVATNEPAKSVDATIEVPSDSSIFTPTSTENVRNMKEAVNKLQKLRSDTEPLVGRVGVRAFARMTSPEPVAPNKDVEVEIKGEPMDFDDADRQMEKMDLMNAFKLRPVNPQNLRDVRINKVVVTPVTKKVVKPTETREPRPRARKTFPQPKKPDDGRSELNSKNSMVYIPIQPPMTQAPRPIAANGPTAMPMQRAIAPALPALPAVSNSNNMVNTATTPLVPVSMSTLSNPTPTPTATVTSSAVGPTVGQVPTTVHTVPLITSVNGQWTFSLQPVMSVGGVDGATSPPMVNGVADRSSVPGLLPLQGGPGVSTPAPGPPPPAPPTLPALAPPAATHTPKQTNSETTLPGEPPRLQQRPSLMNPLDANTPVGSVPPPSTVGPVTAKLNQNAVKMTDFFRTLLEDSIEKLDEPATHATALKIQLEQIRWRHQQEIEEIKHNHELTLAEMRSSFDKEKVRLMSDTRRAAQVELETAVKVAKSKQWCANCSQEAQFYCCWNTSYCDYPCQRAHWAQHYAVCTQQRSQDSCDISNSPESRLQPQPENLPKTTAAPSLTVGGKLAPSRVYTQEQTMPKTSIIVSMVEDNSGNQTMKCVGTYKPNPAPTQNMSPLILNKQIMNNEEAAKKVVTSGGYLIVGAASAPVNTPNNTATIVAPARRAHTIQYFS